MTILSEKLRELRASKGWSQSQVSDFLGYSGNSRVSNWETGLHEPNTNHLIRLSELYGVDLLDYLKESVPVVTSEVSKVLVKHRNDGYFETVLILHDKNLIDEFNERTIFQAIVLGRWRVAIPGTDKTEPGIIEVI